MAPSDEGYDMCASALSEGLHLYENGFSTLFGSGLK
jgi:hypothetical protein